MPMYTFQCECGNEEEHLVPMQHRDQVVIDCSKCRKRMKRAVDSPKLGGEKYQMKAITGDGKKVAGHFGKSAPLNRKK